MPIGQPINQSISPTKNSNETDIFFELIEPRYKLDEVIVNKKTLLGINSLVSLKKNLNKVFNDMGLNETHRYSKKFIVNFYGDPGTGKTITAHAIANEFNKKILLVDYSQIESKYVGDTPKNLKKIFDFARVEDCLVFFDEADAILSRRVTNMQSATDTSVNQTRSVLLNILNDFDGDVIFATNFISNYDPAFLRRISMHVFFDLPDFDARIKLLKKYTPKKILPNLDVAALAKKFDKVSAADIEKGILMSAFYAASLDKSTIDQNDINYQMELITQTKNENAKGVYSSESRFVSQDFVTQQLNRSTQ